jgi:hypothetical protein
MPPRSRGLTDTGHGLAKEAPDQHQHNELSEEDHFGRPALASFGGGRADGAQRKHSDEGSANCRQNEAPRRRRNSGPAVRIMNAPGER